MLNFAKSQLALEKRIIKMTLNILIKYIAE